MKALRTARADGFTYVGLLISVALVGVGLSVAGTLWSVSAQRVRESELLFVGDQYRRALASYAATSPGGARLPQSLEELLEDRRQPSTKRHLRRLYSDPMTEHGRWGLIRHPDGTIFGVYSLSDRKPLKVSGFSQSDGSFAGAKTYQGWRFEVNADAPARPPETGPNTGQVLPGASSQRGPSGTGRPDDESTARAVPNADPSKGEKNCEMQLAEDQATCAVAGQADRRLLGACEYSARTRYGACLYRTPLSPLVTKLPN